MQRLSRTLCTLCVLATAFCLLSIPALPAMADDHAEPKATKTVGWLQLKGKLREGPSRFAWVSEKDAGPSLQGVLDKIKHVQNDKQSLGIVVHLDLPKLTATQTDAIYNALYILRKSGKNVVTFSQSYSTATYMLASAGNVIALQHKGSVELMGMHLEEMYLGGTMKKLGVEPNFIQVGKYKGASEPMTRQGPSDAWSKNMDGLLDGMYSAVIDRIAKGRGLNKDQVEAMMDKSWMLDDQGLVKAGIVDKLCKRDLRAATEPAFGKKFAWDKNMGAGGDEDAANNALAQNPMLMLMSLMQDPVVETTGPTIQVIHANGAIKSGDSSFGDGMFQSESIGSRTVTKMLRDALKDDNIKGVVLRLDSPGGSALASEVMWQAIREFAEAKPIVCSIGSMAASGGYYLAVGCDEIVVEPRAIVGSIGVVAGKLNMKGLFDMVGVNIHTRSRGPNAAMLSSVTNFTDAERKKLKTAMTMIYQQFRDRVSKGRGDRLKDLDAVDEGMLFTGEQAVKSGMADKLGGLDDAIALVAKKAKLKEGDYELMHLPHPISLASFLEEMFGDGGMFGMAVPQQNAAFMAAKKLVGDAAWSSAVRSMQGLMLLREEKVLMLMPQAIVVK